MIFVFLILFLLLIIVLYICFFKKEGYQSNLTKNDIFIQTHHNHIFVDCIESNDIFYVAPYHSKNLTANFPKIKKKNPNKFFILLDGEPNSIQNVDTHLIISTKKDFETNIPFIYLPYFVYSFVQSKMNPNILIKNNEIITKKSKFCCFMYSNCDEKYKGVQDRKKFYYLLNEKSGNRVENLGKCYNNYYKKNGWWHNNFDIYKQYKFVICFENEQINGYISEKIWTPMVHRSIPIYLGSPNIGDYFNTKSFINVADFSTFEECIDYILKIDNDDHLYNSILQEPFLIDNKISYSLFSYFYGGDFYHKLSKNIPPIYAEFIRPCQFYKETFHFFTFSKSDKKPQNYHSAQKSRFFNQCTCLQNIHQFDIKNILKQENDIIIFCDPSVHFDHHKYKQIRFYFDKLMLNPIHFILFFNNNIIEHKFFIFKDNTFTFQYFIINGLNFDNLYKTDYFISDDFTNGNSCFYIE
jgi:hypothetical protein